MPVLVAGSSKGGLGKTTLCQVLAATLAPSLHLVVLGADPTHALSRWVANACGGPVIEAHAEPDKVRLANLTLPGPKVWSRLRTRRTARPGGEAGVCSDGNTTS